MTRGSNPVLAAVVAGLVLGGCAGAGASSSPSGSRATPTTATTAASASVTPSAAAATEATMTASPSQGTAFELTSTAFAPNAAIPRRYGCDGDGASPPLAWSGVPSGTAELELLVDDPDASGFVHWVAVGIDPTTTGLAERATGSDAVPVEGRNSAGRNGWTPPCPPSGTHHYRFTLYAVSKPLGLEDGVSADDLRAAARNVTLGTAQLVGTYAKG
jgi:Raf kinase inhibitor-like YbhB/YbcL family protein